MLLLGTQMKVLKTIKEGGFQPLLDLSISIKEHEDGRVILNYSQLNSPEENEVGRECRGLTVTKGGELVARGFSRFFNSNEALSITKHFRWDMPVKAWDKIDGSYIKIFYYNGWKIQTRNSFAADTINGTEFTWEELVKQVLPSYFFECADKTFSYIFELTSPYNIVVQRHTVVKLWMLAVFNGVQELHDEIVDEIARELGFDRPNAHIFNGIMDAQAYIADQARLAETFEGVVLKDVDGMRLKVKSDKYIALHRMFSNGNILLDKNIIPLILDGELDEAAAYFPMLNERAAILKEKINKLMGEVDNYWFVYHDIDSKKKFALAIKDCKWKPLLFLAYEKGGKPRDYLTADFVEKNL